MFYYFKVEVKTESTAIARKPSRMQKSNGY